MASTSTGHQPATITREQPSSSGQVMRWSSGCSLEMNADSKFGLESGSSFIAESGSRIRYQNITTSTAASTSAGNYGLTVVQTSLPQTLTTPALGRIEDVLFLPTTGKTAHLKTGSTLIYYNSTAGVDHVIKVKPVAAQVSNKGYYIRLFGASTTRWWVGANVLGTSSDNDWTVQFSSST